MIQNLHKGTAFRKRKSCSSSNLNEAGGPFLWHSGQAVMGRPAVIAHAGASSEQAANSRAAFHLAKHLHADAVEADVRLTADGGVICLHDETLFIGSERVEVAQTSYHELLNMSPEVATLQEVVDLGLPLYLDIKEPSVRAKLAVLQLLNERSDAERFIVGISTVKESDFLAENCPRIHQVGLMLPDSELEEFASKRLAGQWIRLHEPRATPSKIACFRDYGVKIMVTCGSDRSRSGQIDPTSFPKLIAAQPDALVVSDPALAISEMARVSDHYRENLG
ncbi:glycerophosphodiester phosphodiesterase [Sinorhizobium meliloti]|uniref:glycerophosphodiester phosphodiesterase n=1 Tax=Rhizobium meliloti TaxID=382 RepID=UPI000695B8F8|nr:glycerophosphodiester phosphodiesterase [Sinorhizobium meliloti]